MKSTTEEILKNLQRFHGSETIYKIPLIQTRYTEGLKYLATAAECFWLLTDVSIMAKSLLAKSYFVTIDFRRLPEDRKDSTGYEAEIQYSDGDGNIFDTHRYNVTDFPLDKLRLFFVDGTLMLPGEY
jgi:hypothetical protein